MRKNLSLTDRAIRVLVALVVVVLYFTNVITGMWITILGILAFVLIATSVINFCPAYAAFKFSTNGKRTPKP